jgi:hypothetical protein
MDKKFFIMASGLYFEKLVWSRGKPMAIWSSSTCYIMDEKNMRFTIDHLPDDGDFEVFEMNPTRFHL